MFKKIYVIYLIFVRLVSNNSFFVLLFFSLISMCTDNAGIFDSTNEILRQDPKLLEPNKLPYVAGKCCCGSPVFFFERCLYLCQRDSIRCVWALVAGSIKLSEWMTRQWVYPSGKRSIPPYDAPLSRETEKEIWELLNILFLQIIWYKKFTWCHILLKNW